MVHGGRIEMLQDYLISKTSFITKKLLLKYLVFTQHFPDISNVGNFLLTICNFIVNLSFLFPSSNAYKNLRLFVKMIVHGI